MPDWTAQTTISGWFFSRTQLSYLGRIVVIMAFTPKDVDIYNGETTITLPIEQASKVLVPTGGVLPMKSYTQDIS